MYIARYDIIYNTHTIYINSFVCSLTNSKYILILYTKYIIQNQIINTGYSCKVNSNFRFIIIFSYYIFSCCFFFAFFIWFPLITRLQVYTSIKRNKETFLIGKRKLYFFFFLSIIYYILCCLFRKGKVLRKFVFIIVYHLLRAYTKLCLLMEFNIIFFYRLMLKTYLYVQEKKDRN